MNILIADDDAVSRRALEVTLAKWGYAVTVAHSGAEAWDVLAREERPELAILDWMMPGIAGPEICRRVREQTDRPYVYILLLTAKTEASDLLEGLEAGADDYLTKPMNIQEMKARLFTGRRILAVQRQLIEAREELRAQAIRDPLTGLFNRRYMEESLGRELHRAIRNHRPLAVIMLDLDHFKRFNDTYGHPAGDALLEQLGSFLLARTRKEDIACRYGGEEFTLILPDSSLAAACERAEGFRLHVRTLAVDLNGKKVTGMMLSAGVAALPDHGLGAGELLAAADKALYRAKAEGRDRIMIPWPAAEPAALASGAPNPSTIR